MPLLGYKKCDRKILSNLVQGHEYLGGQSKGLKGFWTLWRQVIIWREMTMDINHNFAIYHLKI